MPEQRLVKTVSYGRDGSKWRKRRSKKKWLQEVIKDIEEVDIRDWRESTKRVKTSRQEDRSQSFLILFFMSFVSEN